MKKVLGLGNALVDIMTQLKDDSFLDENNLPKGSMQLVELEQSQQVLENAKELEKSQASGGSAANTINGLAQVGNPCGYIGKIQKDELGDFFAKDMQINNIDTTFFYGTQPTGRAVALVSPDSERTFATYLGAAVELTAEDLKPEHFKGYDYFHLEGYLIFNEPLVQRAVELAKAEGLIISIDMASFNVVEAKLDFLKKLIPDYIDIVFANEEEAKAYTGKTPEEALDIFAEQCNIAIVKVGKEGAFIKKGNDKVKVDALNAKPIDTTGAGDLFAAGFLYGESLGLGLEKSGIIGSILAGNVIQFMGPKMDKATWTKINQHVKEVIDG